MTHTTDKDRAEFEAWLPNAYRQPQETYTVHNMEVAFIAGMQAARRAQVVPEGWKLVPEISTEDMEQAAYLEAGAPSDWYGFDDMWRAALAAAPQPPEEAPVQLPEPEGVVTGKLGASTFVAGPSIRKGEKLYTERQVRQLLAQHGIK